jgi:signal transduction histidine kinase
MSAPQVQDRRRTGSGPGFFCRRAYVGKSVGPGLRTVGFAALYVAAAFAGRLTVLPGTSLSLVWPAAGIAVVWFGASFGSRWRYLDAAALVAVTLLVNLTTGATPLMALAFAAANLVQVWVFLRLFGRLCPHLWGAGGRGLLARTGELWRLIAAGAVSTAAGAAVGPSAVWLLTGDYSWLATTVWLTRNTVSIVLIGTLGLRLAFALSVRERPIVLPTGWRLAEYTALVFGSAFAYFVAFGINHGLPLAFPLLIMTVWAGLRLHTTFVVLHDLCVGTAAVLFTLHGDGPFADIPSYGVRALVAQAFVGMVAVVGLALALSRDERHALVRQLSAAERDATRQAGLMSAIVESTDDGLDVVDPAGRVLLRNPAARSLFGGPTGYSGLTLPDGTPIDEHALVAAHGLDVRVGDGRIVQVTAAELAFDPGTGHSAVLMFHDVTAERRHRDDLAGFAGVVAHDLLNPLTTVDGWAEDLADLLEKAPPHPAYAGAERSVARIRRSAERMRGLITDLLAYTTARDGELTPSTIDLRAMITDITAARIDLASAAGTPVPRFEFGELAPVHADPLLVRQVLDNLISNAVKYTAPGATPVVTIGTAEAAPGWREIVVADNGIGIPAGQHEAIFDTFHRAHRASGYAGTGLGLAICKRVVEHHGGTILARDDPGGGTRIRFTLPSAGRDSPASRTQPEPVPTGGILEPAFHAGTSEEG